MKRVYLLLGTNIGDLEENLKQAVAKIAAKNIKVIKKSRIYRTKAWGVSDQPDYLNMAIEAETDLTAPGLLRILKSVEVEMGRKKEHGKWLPRVIDIDILFWGDEVVQLEDLQIPHREFFNRPFAMKILSEIAPDFRPPGREKTLHELSVGVDNEGIEIHRD